LNWSSGSVDLAGAGARQAYRLRSHQQTIWPTPQPSPYEGEGVCTLLLEGYAAVFGDWGGDVRRIEWVHCGGIFVEDDTEAWLL